jgi:hypothetical protein
LLPDSNASMQVSIFKIVFVTVALDVLECLQVAKLLSLV